MAEVDAALERLADELALRDDRIAELEQALVEAVEVVDVVEVVEPVAQEDAPELTEAELTEADEEPPPAAVEAFEPLEPSTVAPAAISGPLTATTWWTELAPEPEAEPAAESEAEPAEEPVQEPQEPELVAEAAALAVPEETAAHEEPLPGEPVATAGLLEPEALTLPAADEAFSFPELHSPAPAEEVAEELGEAPHDWWTDRPERPGADGPSRP
jgi:hypothetical protein